MGSQAPDCQELQLRASRGGALRPRWCAEPEVLLGVPPIHLLGVPLIILLRVPPVRNVVQPLGHDTARFFFVLKAAMKTAEMKCQRMFAKLCYGV